MPKGGARPGSGRPKGSSNPNAGRPRLSASGRKQVQFSLQQSEIDLIDALAEQAGINRSRFIVKCVELYRERLK